MTGWSNGNSFGECQTSCKPAARWRVPPWKFGVGPAAMTDDRGGL